MIRRVSLAISGVLLVLSAAILAVHYAGVGREEGTSIQIGGAFTMLDQDGRAITKADLDRKALALFAGFTYCPDVCPTTLIRLSSLMKRLGDDADEIQVVLVSVDPERDSPEVIKSYLASFGSRFMGMTGTPEQLASFAKAYRIFYEKVTSGDGDYTMNHSAGVFLFRKGGGFQGTIDQHEQDDVALRKLKMLTGTQQP